MRTRLFIVLLLSACSGNEMLPPDLVAAPDLPDLALRSCMTSTECPDRQGCDPATHLCLPACKLIAGFKKTGTQACQTCVGDECTIFGPGCTLDEAKACQSSCASSPTFEARCECIVACLSPECAPLADDQTVCLADHCRDVCQ